MKYGHLTSELELPLQQRAKSTIIKLWWNSINKNNHVILSSTAKGGKKNISLHFLKTSWLCQMVVNHDQIQKNCFTFSQHKHGHDGGDLTLSFSDCKLEPFWSVKVGPILNIENNNTFCACTVC